MSAPYQGELWSRFCDGLKALGHEVLRAESPTDDFNRAEGYRYLTRMLRDGIMRQVEFIDPAYPVLYDLNPAWVSIGSSPDNEYFMSFIDGRLDYCLSGNRGGVHYIGISTKTGGYEKEPALSPSGFIDSTILKTDADGNFEIHLSQKPQPGNWLQMSPATTNLIVRQTFLDRKREKPAQMRLECINPGREPLPLDPYEFPDRLMAVLKYMKGNFDVSGNWTRMFQTAPNSFYPLDQDVYLKAGGDPTIFYAQGYWQLHADEALVVDVPKLECEFWNFQINNYWSEVVGFNQKPSAVNKSSAKVDDEGRARLVVAHADPGRPNWIPTLGHDRGSMIFRIINGRPPEAPTARLVKMDQISA
ncbi:MAG TPA: DUF1214 domain-containing protein [Alphaproteobacteria bacterium]|nr:DUF1214 domain-containing protein [Alphaproteobacteria bacterium]